MTSDTRTAATITTSTLNRQPLVTIPGNPPVTGTLTGILPTGGNRIQLALIIGGSRAWLDVDADTEIEVHREEKP